MTSSSFVAALAAIFLVACSSPRAVIGESAGTTGAGGSSPGAVGMGQGASTVGTGPGGAITVGGPASSGGAGGAGGVFACPGTIELSDNGVPAKLGGACGNPLLCTGTTDGAAAYEMGPFAGSSYLCLAACADDGQLGHEIDMIVYGATPGVYDASAPLGVRVDYRLGGLPQELLADVAQVHLEQVGAVGEPIVGTFTAGIWATSDMGIDHFLKGSFQVCRLPDQSGP